MNCISCLMIYKIYFWSEFPNIPKKMWSRRWRKPASVVLFKQTRKRKNETKTTTFSVLNVVNMLAVIFKNMVFSMNIKIWFPQF